MGRLLKGVETGAAMGADGIGRWLAPEQRARLVAPLLDEAATRAEALTADARAAAAILQAAEAEADAVRQRAWATAYQEGHAAGYADGVAALAGPAAMLRRAAEAQAAVRQALLAGAEEQTVALAMAIARRIVGGAAENHADGAAALAATALATANTRVLQVRTHPDDAEAVTAALLDVGAPPVHGDGAVEAGGCLIDVEGGCIDLRLDVQLARIADALGLSAS
ncbi:MAG: FliH/SctL family protein [Dehalococcoidia bacterium]